MSYICFVQDRLGRKWRFETERALALDDAVKGCVTIPYLSGIFHISKDSVASITFEESKEDQLKEIK